MIPLSLESIKEHLFKQKFEPEVQKETNQLYLILKQQGREYPLFIRIYEGNDLLQLLVFIPCVFKKNVAGELARLLLYINKELDIPGFGMDESSSLVFFRVMVQIYENQLPAQTLDSLMNAIQVICQTFSPAIASVAAGASTFDDVLKKVKDAQTPTPQ